MRILFYGRLAEVMGRELELSAQQRCSIAELRERIAAERPEAAEPMLNKRVRACIGDAIVGENHIVAPGEHVEFFPPVSGG
jgi:molybdopterin converting factor small subunit